MASKILVLDDEEPILRMLKRRFTAYFFEVDAVRREEEAKRLIAKQTYSVVILDLGLSFLDHTGGLDLIRYIQRRSPSTGIVASARPLLVVVDLRIATGSFADMRVVRYVLVLAT